MPCCAYLLSLVRLFVTLWIVACQVPLCMGILQARILVWVAASSPGDLPSLGTDPVSPSFPALAVRFFTICAMEQLWHRIVLRSE